MTPSSCARTFNVSALLEGAEFFFLKPEVESGPRGFIAGRVIGRGHYGGILVRIGTGKRERTDEWSRLTMVVPVSTTLVRF